MILVKNNEKIYKRDETNLKNAPSFLAAFIIFCTFVIIILLFFSLYALFIRDYLSLSIQLGIIAILQLFLCACDKLNWIYDVEYHFKGENSFIYQYNLDANLVPSKNRRVTVKVKNVRRMKETKRNLILYGEFSKKAPLSKEKIMKKFTLAKIPEHNNEIIFKIKKLNPYCKITTTF